MKILSLFFFVSLIVNFPLLADISIVTDQHIAGPTQGGPIVNATFKDMGSYVQLTATPENIISPGYQVDSFNFNLNPSISPFAVTATYLTPGVSLIPRDRTTMDYSFTLNWQTGQPAVVDLMYPGLKAD